MELSAKIKEKVLQCFERNSQNLGHTNMISLGQTSKGSARAARVPVSTSCLSWSRPVFELQESEHCGQCKDGAQTRHFPPSLLHPGHPGSGLLCSQSSFVTSQVLGEPGVWSALSFLGGNAGKRSADETQVLFKICLHQSFLILLLSRSSTPWPRTWR